MHDPSTVAFDIKYPWRQRPSQFWPKGYRSTFITIWHEDPMDFTGKCRGRYVNEFAFRLNDGNVKRHTMERLESFVSGTKGKRLTYKGLIQ